ncbi:MAG TPA: hypothetical protein VEC12_03920 [Bacteroidia bacterium]|nr:hypothetical protein [Bacteroidia bacterium]
MRKVIAILFIVAAATACKKDGDRHTVKGRLLNSCDDPTPLRGFTVYLYNDYRNLLNRWCNQGQIATATTNENGEFELSYEKTCSNGDISLQYDINSISYGSLVYNIEPNKSTELGDIFRKNNGPFQVKIKTNQPYSNNDTLFYGIRPHILDSTYKFITGPFTDGQLVDNYLITVWRIHNRSAETNHLFRWVLKSGKNSFKDELQEAYIDPCKNNEIVLDISK